MRPQSVWKAMEIAIKHLKLNIVDIMTSPSEIYEVNYATSNSAKVNTLDLRVRISEPFTPLTEYIELSIRLIPKDIEGKNETLNKYVGDLSKYDEETQEALRIAWIISQCYKWTRSGTTKVKNYSIPFISANMSIRSI